MDKVKELLKKYWGYFVVIIICIYVLTINLNNYFNTHSVNKDFNSLNLDNYNKVMIVAHPDDDILWGGAHLIEDNYLVVCITCGTDKIRVNEFVRLMNSTNDKYIMLGYPDKTNGERDNWDTCYDDITKDIESILSLKDWELIVTHNPDGEYGHQHHKMTNKIVTSVTDNNNLYYFGIYHSKKTISSYLNEMTPIKDSTLAKKKNLIGIYKSQSFIQTMFDHMYPYENWVNSQDWSYEDNEEII